MGVHPPGCKCHYCNRPTHPVEICPCYTCEQVRYNAWAARERETARQASYSAGAKVLAFWLLGVGSAIAILTHAFWKR